ncbi:FAA hydrolase family protein, partial [Halomonas marinisediminis]
MRFLVGHVQGQPGVFAIVEEAATNLTALMPEIGTDLAA